MCGLQDEEEMEEKKRKIVHKDQNNNDTFRGLLVVWKRVKVNKSYKSSS